MKFEIGNQVRLKKHPELKGKIKKKPFDHHTNKRMYILDFGWYFEEELELITKN